MRAVLLVVVAVSACAGHKAPPPAPPPPAPASAPAPAAAPAAADPRMAVVDRMMRDQPAADAPAELAQFGRLVGTWRCTSARRQADGSFADTPGESTWSWYYTVDGHAILDVFEPAPGGKGSVGVNLRVYDPDAGQWQLAWTHAALRAIDRFTARAEGDTMVMRGELPARGPFPAHSARITFSQITADGFDWVYEATKPGGDNWQPFSRIRCRRAG